MFFSSLYIHINYLLLSIYIYIYIYIYTDVNITYNPGCSVRAPSQNLPFAGTAGKVVEFSLRTPAVQGLEVQGSSPEWGDKKFLKTD